MRHTRKKLASGKSQQQRGGTRGSSKRKKARGSKQRRESQSRHGRKMASGQTMVSAQRVVMDVTAAGHVPHLTLGRNPDVWEPNKDLDARTKRTKTIEANGTVRCPPQTTGRNGGNQ